jgi:hypothetical protein
MALLHLVVHRGSTSLALHNECPPPFTPPAVQGALRFELLSRRPLVEMQSCWPVW